MTNFPPTPTKAELLANVRTGCAKLESLLEALTPEQLTQPNVQDDWSIKDMLAHIAAWERFTIARLEAMRDMAPLKIPPVTSDEQVDAMNARVYAENQARPLAEVMADFQATHQALYTLVESLDEAFLQGAVPFEWGEGRPIWGMVAANTYWHYPEHQAAIEAYLDL